MMGTGIATTVASHGFSVVAVKATGGHPLHATRRIQKQLDRGVKKGRLTAEERDDILSRIEVSAELSALSDCDLVIESAVEDLAAKLDLLKRIEEHISHSTILATNTSSLPLETLAVAVERPEELLALHFFNPVGAMKLVELSATTLTAPGAIVAARAFCVRIGKVPVDVMPSPGYVVNRLLVPMLLHAIETLESGVATPDAIDTAMTLGAGHPMGPLALADLIGLDVVLAMATTLKEKLRDKRYRAPSLLRRLVLAGDLGRKTRRGIYDYRGDTPVVNPYLLPALPDDVAAGAAE